MTSSSMRHSGSSALRRRRRPRGRSGGVVLNAGDGPVARAADPGMTGRSSATASPAPRCSSNVAGNGEGQITGHAADATETRIR